MTVKTQSKPTRKCHWVPQSYLKHFAVPESKPPRVWAYPKDAKEPALKRIQKVAVKNHLYVPKNEQGERDDSFEKRLAGLETWLGHPLWNRLATKEVDLSWEPMRKMISLTVANMYLRNPNTFDIFIEMHCNIRASVLKYGGVPDEIHIKGESFLMDKSSWPAFRDGDENFIKKIWLAELGNAAALAKDLMKMRWTMLCLKDPLFVTSDNPVTLTHPSLKFRGFQNPETSVYFPLSPTRLLLFDHLYEDPANEYRHCLHDGAVPNLFAWRGAIQHVFSPNEDDTVLNNLLINEELSQNQNSNLEFGYTN